MYGRVVIGRLVWAGRTDEFPNHDYVTPKKITDTPTSGTFISCLCFTRVVPTYSGYMPHVDGNHLAFTPNGIPDAYAVQPQAEGLVFAYMDGSGRWVPFQDTKAVWNHNWRYYDPNRQAACLSHISSGPVRPPRLDSGLLE